MTADEFTASFEQDRRSGERPEVILRDGTTTTVRGLDRARELVLCDLGRTVPLSRLERTGSTFFERNVQATKLGMFKAR